MKKLRQLNWNLINPFEKNVKKQHQEIEERQKPKDNFASQAAQRCMMGVILGTMLFLLLGGLLLFILFRDQSAQFLFGVFAILIFLTTLVFAVALYVALGFLQKKALAMKQMREEKAKQVEPPEKRDMPKRRKM